jgi:hypothetical protein
MARQDEESDNDDRYADEEELLRQQLQNMEKS